MAKITSILIAVALVVAVAGYWAWTTHLSPEAKERRAKAMAGTAALREGVLSRTMLIEATGADAPLRAYVMDWQVGGSQLATLVSFDDGTTSIYLSSGGGIIGAGTIPSVQPVASEFRDTFKSLEKHFRPVSAWPPPSDGGFVFYLVDRESTRATTEFQGSELRSRNHPLTTLESIGQKLFTAVRTAKPESPEK